VADYILEYRPSFPYFNILALTNLPRWIYSWANFDGVHYLRIAETGYQQTALIQAFFPVYPYLLRFTSLMLEIKFLLAGLILSNLMFLLCILLLFIYVKQRFSVNLGWKTILVLLI